jgi:hypothetical protein
MALFLERRYYVRFLAVPLIKAGAISIKNALRGVHERGRTFAPLVNGLPDRHCANRLRAKGQLIRGGNNTHHEDQRDFGRFTSPPQRLP